MSVCNKRYRREEAAAYLQVSKSFLDKARAAGTGPAYTKIARAIIYEEPDLDAYREACRVEPKREQRTETASP